MTTKPNDKIDADGAWDYSHGLTKRELFAAMAMQGVLAYVKKSAPDPEEQKIMAKYAVEQADALIEALNDGKEQP